MSQTHSSQLPDSELIEVIEQAVCRQCQGHVPSDSTRILYIPATDALESPIRDHMVYCDHCNVTHVERQELGGSAWRQAKIGSFSGNRLPPRPKTVVTSPAPRAARRRKPQAA